MVVDSAKPSSAHNATLIHKDRTRIPGPRDQRSRQILSAPLGKILGIAGLLGLLLITTAIALNVAAEPSNFLRAGRNVTPDWLLGPLHAIPTSFIGLDHTMTPATFVFLLLCMFVCWGVLVAFADRLPRKLVFSSAMALITVMALAPPMLSTDAMTYLGYARLGVLHDLSPYLHGPGAAAQDPIFPMTGHNWSDTPSAYGPIFTLLSYALVPLGISGALWTLKGLMALAAIGSFALVWRNAPAFGRRPASAACFAMLSPPVLLFSVAGAHNDLLMAFFALVAVVAVVRGRELTSGAALVVSAAVKMSLVVLWPFLLIGVRQRWRWIVGATGAAMLIALVALPIFGPPSLALTGKGPPALSQSLSILGPTAEWLGHGGMTSGTKEMIARIETFVLVGMLGLLSLGTLARRNKWLTGAVFMVIFMLITAMKLEPWYACWIMPIAALSTNRVARVTAGGLAIVLCLIWARGQGISLQGALFPF